MNAVPAPTLMSLSVDCRGSTSGQAAGKRVVAETSYGEQMLQVVDGAVQGMGPSLPPFSASLCSALFDSDARDSSEWSAPRPPPAVAKLLQRYQAKALFVPAVSSEWQCLSAGDTTTTCKENRIDVVAYVFTADEVIWKSDWRLGIGNETPDLSGGAAKLFEGAPIASVARLQDPEAPTYERALEEAGVAP